MAVVCPHCQHSAQVKSAKPGRFTPKCPKCFKPFVVIVPNDPEQAWKVLPLNLEETRPPSDTVGSAAPQATSPLEAEAGATGEFDPNATRPPLETRREADDVTGATG